MSRQAAISSGNWMTILERGYPLLRLSIGGLSANVRFTAITLYTGVQFLGYLRADLQARLHAPAGHMCFVSKLVVEKLERENRPLYTYRWLGDKSNVSKGAGGLAEASENQIFLRARARNSQREPLLELFNPYTQLLPCYNYQIWVLGEKFHSRLDT